MTASENSSTLLEAVLERQQQEWLAGRRPSIAELIAGMPFEHDPEAQLDLVYHEILVQENLGLEPVLQDYIAQYPHLREDLELHFEIHRAMNQQLLVDVREQEPDQEIPWSESAGSVTGPDRLKDKYEISSELGLGGMAVVYRARHRRLNRDVALKMFQPGRIPNSREYFRIRVEAEAMARLSHPNILQIFEIGQSQGIPWLAIELAEQGTLAQKLQQFPFTPTAAAELLMTLAAAVQHAHDRGVIHRDLKPANVLFSADGTAKISDFGLARMTQDQLVSSQDATRSGETIGTPRYMAPEQAAGDHRRMGPATDVYALGTILYECLTGRPPFIAAGVVETLQMILTQDPLPPKRLQPAVPRDLETICLHCLHKVPARRYSSAKEFAADLKCFLDGRPIHVRPVSVAERVTKWCRRKPSQATLVGVTLLLLIVTAVTLLLGAQAEQHRIRALRQDVSRLMNDGRLALESDDADTAYTSFHDAWLKIQAEPELADHETSIAGWLDHSRNAANRSQWAQRVPPRTFEDRRDEACVESLLLNSWRTDPAAYVCRVIRSTTEFTPPNDRRWQVERQRLIQLEADLTEQVSGPEEALRVLAAAEPFTARHLFVRRAVLLEQAGRTTEAQHAMSLADAYPADLQWERMVTAMTLVRERKFDLAERQCAEVLDRDPEHFTARLIQAVCFLRARRTAEARVALTACTAQRPNFRWNQFFLGQLERLSGNDSAAERHLSAAMAEKASAGVRAAALMERGILHLRRGEPRTAEPFFRALAALEPGETAPGTGIALSELMSSGWPLAPSGFLKAWSLPAGLRNTHPLILKNDAGLCVLEMVSLNLFPEWSRSLRLVRYTAFFPLFSDLSESQQMPAPGNSQQESAQENI